jgi:hypothetical protein
LIHQQKKVNFYERLASKREGRKEMGGFCFITAVSSSEKYDVMRRILKTGLVLQLATQQDLNCFRNKGYGI